MRNAARLLAAWSAFAGYALFVGMIIWAGAAWPGYDHLRQFISELGATGAPNGQVFGLWGFIIPGALMMVFPVAAFLALPRSAASLIGFALILLFASGTFFGGVYPCDFGCVTEGGSYSQHMHELLGLGGYLTAPLALFVAGLASRRWPGAGGLFPLGVCTAVVAAVAMPVMVMNIEFDGAAQRALEGAMALWILACAAYLARKPRSA
jgi:hypothetical protein